MRKRSKTERNILVAFILNLLFSIFEFVGGAFTGSVAIMSDAIHDMGDAASIGCSYLLEKKSKNGPDKSFTFGYGRYSVIGSLITNMVLLFGTLTVMQSAIGRLFRPMPVNYNGMMLFAIVGVIVNFAAAWFTKDGDSHNQKAVNLHMLEDVLGWIVVLIGAVIMRFTNLFFLDSVMSLGVSFFIIYNVARNTREVFEIILEKAPHGLNAEKVKEIVSEVDGVQDVHHIHVWTLDEYNNCASMHIVTGENVCEIKEKIKSSLGALGIQHVTLEFETGDERCDEKDCKAGDHSNGGCCTHHHCHHRHNKKEESLGWPTII